MLSPLFINLFLALVFGAAIGLERESSKPGDSTVGSVGGIRTFALISLMGGLAGVLIIHNFVGVALSLVGGYLILLIAYYVGESKETKHFGITSELSAIATFFIGMLVVLDVIPVQITVAIFVMLVFLMSLKARTTQLMAGISSHEVQAFISYAIIALVALPVLPDYSYKLKDLPVLHDIMQGLNVDLSKFDSLDLINPRKIWLVVVLITGIDVFGYVLGRIVGNRSGFALASFMAGFVSSTSTTQSLAQRSKNAKYVNHLVGAAVLANLASFLQIFLLVGPLNPRWMVSIAPSILLMVLSAAVISWVYFKKEEPKEEEETGTKKSDSIFSLLPALKFAGILVVIKIVTRICLIVFGQSGFVFSSVIASFAGIDAIIVNLADMAGHSITFEFALLTFLAINATNLLSKSVYSYMQGSRQFALKFFLSMMGVVLVGSIWLLFV